MRHDDKGCMCGFPRPGGAYPVGVAGRHGASVVASFDIRCGAARVTRRPSPGTGGSAARRRGRSPRRASRPSAAGAGAAAFRRNRSRRWTCVEIKILRRARAESSRRPPRHRRDACSIAWRCRFLTARRSQLSGAPDALVDFHTAMDPRLGMKLLRGSGV